MTAVEQRAETKRQEQLKDRRAYLATLIQRSADVDARIATVEKQIRALAK